MSDYESELRRRLRILKEYFEQGKISIAPDLQLERSILAIRYGEDGEVDLNTVDGRVRSLALAITAMNDREDLKKIASLRDIQEAYFRMLEVNFGSLHRKMRDKGATPHQLAMALSQNVDSTDELYKRIPDIFDWLEDFWANAHDIVGIHIQDMNVLKAVFGGSLHPDAVENIASTTGAYIDTIVLPDPFLRSSLFLKSDNKKQAVRHLIKSAATLLEYKELALADVTPAIVAVLPDERFNNPASTKFLLSAAEKDVVVHLNKLLGRSFSDVDEIFEYVTPLGAVADVLGVLKDRSRLVFDTDSTATISDQFDSYLDDASEFTGEKHAGRGLIFHSVGRMRQANDVLLRAQSLGGSPLLDAPTSWQHFQWKLEYDAERIETKSLEPLHMCRALQTAAKTEMAWLGNVPHSALIEIRKLGALPEIRNLLTSGVSKLIQTNPSNFHRTSDKVVENLQNAFDAHARDLKNLTAKKWRFAGVDLATCVVRGVVEIASACGVPGVSLINTAINETLDPPKFKELPAKYRQLKTADQQLKASPVGLLFKHSKL